MVTTITPVTFLAQEIQARKETHDHGPKQIIGPKLRARISPKRAVRRQDWITACFTANPDAELTELPFFFSWHSVCLTAWHYAHRSRGQQSPYRALLSVSYGHPIIDLLKKNFWKLV